MNTSELGGDGLPARHGNAHYPHHLGAVDHHLGGLVHRPQGEVHRLETGTADVGTDEVFDNDTVKA